MTPLQKRIRETVFTLEERIDSCRDALKQIRNFCKHDSCYTDMRRTRGTFLPCRICVACGGEVGEPTNEEAHKCITDYDNALRQKKNLQ